MLFINKKQNIYNQLTDLNSRLRTIENELFVENYFYSFPDSQGIKKLSRRDALVFSRVRRDYFGERVIICYTNESDYKIFEALIKQWGKEVMEWEKKHKKIIN